MYKRQVENGELKAHPFTPRGTRAGQWLLGRSALYAWQKHVVRRAFFRARAAAVGGDPMHAVFSTRADPGWDEAWAVTEALLARIAERTRAAGVPLLMLVIPDVNQVDDVAWETVVKASPNLAPMDRELPQRRLQEIAQRRGLRMVDLLPVLRAAGGALGGVDPLYDGHLVHRGHRVTSEIVEREVKALLPVR